LSEAAAIGVYTFTPLRDWPAQHPEEYLYKSVVLQNLTISPTAPDESSHNPSVIRYDTIEEFNVDSKAEYTA